MIDAPDHIVQERGNHSTWVWLLAALVGIALSVVAGMMSYGYTTAQAEQRFADVVDYVATQSLSYDAFNSAYATKNLIRVMEIAGEAARDIERDGSTDSTTLEQYADQFNVSALIVTDASGTWCPSPRRMTWATSCSLRISKKRPCWRWQPIRLSPIPIVLRLRMIRLQTLVAWLGRMARVSLSR